MESRNCVMQLESNKNIFCVSNPARILDGLWMVLGAGCDHARDFSDIIIFLPSRRAVRRVEKMFVNKIGGAVILPRLVALGEGADEDEGIIPDTISNTERVLLLAKILAADPDVNGVSAALPIARDLVRMQDYLENENIDAHAIDWENMVDEKYAAHFQKKAKILNIIGTTYGRPTAAAARNAGILSWKNHLGQYSKIVVCGSTASVRPTAELMAHIANLPNGYIILSGKISGNPADFELDTNPYNAEYKFLNTIDVHPNDVILLDVEPSEIDFYNDAFGNNTIHKNHKCNAKLIECDRESTEAECVAEIAARAIAQNKKTLVITPDAAGNQRIAAALHARGIVADFSGGQTGAMTRAGRAILNLLDDWIENASYEFENLYRKNSNNLFETIVEIIDTMHDVMMPRFEIDTDDSVAIWNAMRDASDSLLRQSIEINLADARAIISDVLSGVSVRPPLNDDASVVVLGTIESRMQTADIVILTGLNENMFPAPGYENNWLPRNLSIKIGLPSPGHKVSLMALDFMTLSCADDVYWLRSKTAGGVQTNESRFISRADVAAHGLDTTSGADILNAVIARDDVPPAPLDYSPPRVPADTSDVYVTELELLTHNPYAFYARHILRLYPKNDYWAEPDQRDFGNLVHDVAEKARDWRADKIVAELDARAREILTDGSVIFHFWHKRFLEIAPEIEKIWTDTPNALTEVSGRARVAMRNVFARADRIWDGGVLDIKTGAAPNKKQLTNGNMPQLPLEAFIMQSGGFPVAATTPVIQFLRLQNNHVSKIEYDRDTVADMIRGTLDKITGLFQYYSTDGVPYEYRETGNKKYKVYDDLARVDD